MAPGAALRAAIARAPEISSVACNDSRAHRRVEMLARALSSDLVNHTGYNVHGLFGIFARGDRMYGRDQHLHLNYAGTKTRFLLSRTCALARARPHRNLSICEVGFNACLSSLLLLEAAPEATVHSFDLGDMPWSSTASRILRDVYGPARFSGVVFGDSARTIRARHRERPLDCDVAFVDGDKSFEGRLQSLLDLRNVSRPGALVLLDDLNSRACITGAVPRSESNTDFVRRCMERQVYATAVRAYDRASRAGVLRVRECVWPSGYEDRDGMCAAEFPTDVRAESERWALRRP